MYYRQITLACFLTFGLTNCHPSLRGEEPIVLKLENANRLQLVNLQATPATYAKHRCLRLTAKEEADCLAVVKDVEFRNGILEVEVMGHPRKDAPPFAKGFIGIAFRLQSPGDGSYECVYLRPVNARSNDQLSRNHATQYSSHPDHGWRELREQSPGKYEAYVDIDMEQWTKMRIAVEGTRAKLFINGAEQPCLIVNDLKLGDRTGAVAIWSHSSTDAYVRNLRIQPASQQLDRQ